MRAGLGLGCLCVMGGDGREIDEGGPDGQWIGVEWQLCMFQARTQKVHLISTPAA